MTEAEKARDLLAAEYDAIGVPSVAMMLRSGTHLNEHGPYAPAVRTIESALSLRGEVTCRHEPFEGACIHCGVPFRFGQPYYGEPPLSLRGEMVVEECADCGGAGVIFGHAPGCDNDSCALAGGIDDCNGEVVDCHCAEKAPAPDALIEALRPFADAWREARCAADIAPMIDTARKATTAEDFRRASSAIRSLAKESDRG